MGGQSPQGFRQLGGRLSRRNHGREMRGKEPFKIPARLMNRHPLRDLAVDMLQNGLHRTGRCILRQLPKGFIGGNASPQLQFQLVEQRHEVPRGDRQPGVPAIGFCRKDPDGPQ